MRVSRDQGNGRWWLELPYVTLASTGLSFDRRLDGRSTGRVHTTRFRARWCPPRGPRCTIGQRARHRSYIPLNQASGYPVTAKKRNIGPARSSVPKRLLPWSTPRSPTPNLFGRLRWALPLPYVQGKQRWIRGWVFREAAPVALPRSMRADASS